MSRIGKLLIEAMGEVLADVKGHPTETRKHVVMVPAEVDVKAIRRRLRMSQSVFAGRFGFSLGTVQNWERGHRRPEGAARALLKVIDRRPDAVLEALAEDDRARRAPRRADRPKARRAAAAEMSSRRRNSKPGRRP
jgi:putative transcriptional regulator